MRISDGVQTCALPISVAREPRRPTSPLLDRVCEGTQCRHAIPASGCGTKPARCSIAPSGCIASSSFRSPVGPAATQGNLDRKSVGEGKSDGVRVDQGGSRICKKKNNKYKEKT